MKKLIVFILFSSVIFFAYGQKPDKNSVTSEVQLNFQTGTSAISISSPELKGRYFFNNQFAGRLTFGIWGTKTVSNYFENPDGTGGVGKQEKSSSEFTIGLGVEKHLKGTERLSPYFGAGILYSSGTTDEITRSNTDGTNYAPNFIQNIIPGATNSFGLNVLMGADYYFVNNIYIGIEIAWGYQSGTTAQGTDESITSGNVSTIYVTPETSTTGFAVSTNSGLRLGFRF